MIELRILDLCIDPRIFLSVEFPDDLRRSGCCSKLGQLNWVAKLTDPGFNCSVAYEFIDQPKYIDTYALRVRQSSARAACNQY